MMIIFLSLVANFASAVPKGQGDSSGLSQGQATAAGSSSYQTGGQQVQAGGAGLQGNGGGGVQKYGGQAGGLQSYGGQAGSLQGYGGQAGGLQGYGGSDVQGYGDQAGLQGYGGYEYSSQIQERSPGQGLPGGSTGQMLTQGLLDQGLLPPPEFPFGMVPDPQYFGQEGMGYFGGGQAFPAIGQGDGGFIGQGAPEDGLEGHSDEETEGRSVGGIGGINGNAPGQSSGQGFVQGTRQISGRAFGGQVNQPGAQGRSEVWFGGQGIGQINGQLNGLGIGGNIGQGNQGSRANGLAQGDWNGIGEFSEQGIGQVNDQGNGQIKGEVFGQSSGNGQGISQGQIGQAASGLQGEFGVQGIGQRGQVGSVGGTMRANQGKVAQSRGWPAQSMAGFEAWKPAKGSISRTGPGNTGFSRSQLGGASREGGLGVQDSREQAPARRSEEQGLGNQRSAEQHRPLESQEQDLGAQGSHRRVSHYKGRRQALHGSHLREHRGRRQRGLIRESSQRTGGHLRKSSQGTGVHFRGSSHGQGLGVKKRSNDYNNEERGTKERHGNVTREVAEESKEVSDESGGKDRSGEDYGNGLIYPKMSGAARAWLSLVETRRGRRTALVKNAGNRDKADYEHFNVQGCTNECFREDPVGCPTFDMSKSNGRTCEDCCRRVCERDACVHRCAFDVCEFSEDGRPGRKEECSGCLNRCYRLEKGMCVENKTYFAPFKLARTPKGTKKFVSK